MGGRASEATGRETCVIVASWLAAAAAGPSCARTAADSAAPRGGEAPAERPPAPAHEEQRECDVLPLVASRRLQEALVSSRIHSRHAWRDIPPFNADGTLNAYVEIPLGESRKWEFDIATHQLRLDRTIDESLGGYPINYGFVPQTVSCDGDPFDVLVLGPPLVAGTVVRGSIVAVLYMQDEKGADSKVIIAPSSTGNATPHELTPALKSRLQGWFDAYKANDADGRWSAAHGFGDAAAGKRLAELTHRFYEKGRASVAPE